MALTVLAHRFLEEYFIDWNKTGAMRRAGSKAKNHTQAANEMMSNPEVLMAIEAKRKELREACEASSSFVLTELRDHVVADPRDLIELRRDCCRYCYGKDHQYQETPAERRARRLAHDQLLKVTPEKDWRHIAPFDEMGGVGFNPKRPPVEDCPECWGDGVERVVAKDTRYLSPAAAKLYRGVKVTKEGVEVKMTDPKFALDKLGQNLGLWKDQNDDPSGGQVTVQVVQISPEQAKALPPPDPQDYET